MISLPARPEARPRRVRHALLGALAAALCTAPFALAAGPWGAGTLTDGQVEDLVASMTLAEKISMVQGAPDTSCRHAVVSPTVQGCVGQAGYVPGIARLGIPPLRMSDGPAGVKLVHVATALPAPVGLAATFDRRAATTAGTLMALEARALNQDVLLAPMLNQVIIPTAGRNFEVLGEDPYLAGQMVRRLVAAIQGEGVIATLKQFAQNSFELGRTSTSVAIDGQSLREMDLRAFEDGIAAGAGAVMCAYNRLNDVQACSSDGLLNRILRDEYGFTGWVISDWGAAEETSDLVFGLDMAMPRGEARNGWDEATLTAAVQQGLPELPETNDWPAVPAFTGPEIEAALDTAVHRILSRMNDAGLLEGTEHGSMFTGGTPHVPPRPDLDTLRAGHLETARLLAERSAILLKNDGGLLPLDRSDALVVMGPSATRVTTGGGGSSKVRPWDPVVAPWQALMEAGAGSTLRWVPGYDLDGVILPSSALAAPDTSSPYPAWTLRPEDEPFSGAPGLLRQQITTDPVAPGSQPLLAAGAGAAPDRLDPVLDATGAASLPAGTAWRWTGTFQAPRAGEWQLKVFARGQALAELFIDGLETAHRAIRLGEYPVPPLQSYARLDQEEQCHDPACGPLQQATFAVDLLAGEMLHLDLRAVAGAAGPAEIQLRWIPPGWEQEKIAEAVAAAAAAERAVIFAHDEGREGRDRGYDDPVAGLALPGYQDDLIAAVASTGTPTVVVLNIGGPVLMPWIDEVDAVLITWYPGQMGGAATANLLLGLSAPGGRLPVTFPADPTHYPQHDPGCTDRSIGGNCPLYPGVATLGFLGVEPHGYRTIDFAANGILVGYRWYDREGIEPLFPFGHGLTYAGFRYSRLRLSPTEEGGIRVRFHIRNIGLRRGDAVPQVYLGPSPRLPAGVRQAERKLVQFDRIGLAPGRGREVELVVSPRELSSWSERQGAWLVGGGPRQVYVGESSRDIRLRGMVRAAHSGAASASPAARPGVNRGLR